MRRYALVADSARARIFVLETTRQPELDGGPCLVESESLVDPEERIPDAELLSEARGGRAGTPGGRVVGYDDHHEGRITEHRRRFARFAVERTLARLEGTPRGTHLLLVAEPKMLAALRAESAPLERAGLALAEHAGDLTRLSAHELQAHLAREGLLPARKPAPSARTS